MSKLGFGFLDGKVFSRNIQRWARAARLAGKTELPQLRRQRNRARMLKFHLDKLIHTADERLALPMIGSTSFPKPHNADWAWRPELWRGPLSTPGLSSVQTKSLLGNEVTLFHDCDYSELTLRQLRNLREADLAPYGLRLDVFKFDGSFLSLVIDLPEEGVIGLKRTHLLRMDAIVELEMPLEIFARLNIRHGPNTEQIVRELPLNEENHRVEFDLAYSNLNEKRVERAWVDVIFEGPQMNQVILRDLTFSRRPRAQL
ncbi:hypothetical protein BOO69_16990 [Sulfitobacter alexandrii]|uniref:Uncharacterized protein n=1 Tax=Sulfitobacter alexandrii TaxID=1917485 RepID=A0A1J0WKP3_9RHOB|nr:DUF6478 family protein [Sulfitobacter alexandrii]APE44913.1 hypothetical protein BOO69_16990 [Sulfitobacter alexandrii]